MIKLLLLAMLAAPPSIYSLSFTDFQGNRIPFSSFQGKKILLVNVASGSPQVGQLAELETLYQQNKDSVIIIAFPCNDFGHEADTDSAIRQIAFTQYNIHFILASRIAVRGNVRDGVYQWLTDRTLNGVATNEVGADFYKFLIDNSGHWMGVFSERVDPMSQTMKNAIKN